MNLAGVIRAHAERFPEKIAIRFRDQLIDYENLWLEVERLAAWLQLQGVNKGDRVGLSMAEHPRHLIAHFAVARISAVIVPMDHRWTDSEKKSAIDAFDVRVVLDDASDTDIARRPELLPIEEADADLLISLSSGTTGKPKGALVTHQNLYERFVSQWQAIGYGENDCFAILTPFYFGAGRSFGMSLLAAGGTVLIAPPPMKPPEIIKALQQEFVTATFLPPTLLRRLFEHHSGDKRLFENMDYLIVSGEPLYADEALLVLEKICANLYSYYASSEGGGISVLRAEDFAEHAATVGRPTYKTEVEIVDAEDKVVSDGIVGRLRYRGPGVATRYVDADGDEKQAGVGGWFYPGDLAERLSSGHIALRGRDKDVIIRGGVNIYPAEIEAVLLQHADIDEAAVVGVDDAHHGQIIKAFVSGNVDANELADWCRDRLAPYKIPQEFSQLADLPRRSSGKVDKQALLNQS
jgi:acyl-CoA synthetase (AMP-forming)/AMP-acid ligase II